jgi:hypothetical protein
MSALCEVNKKKVNHFKFLVVFFYDGMFFLHRGSICRSLPGLPAAQEPAPAAVSHIHLKKDRCHQRELI